MSHQREAPEKTQDMKERLHLTGGLETLQKEGGLGICAHVTQIQISNKKMNEWINGDKKKQQLCFEEQHALRMCVKARFLVSWFSLFYMMMVSSSSYCRF